MKAFLMALIALVLITVLANQALVRYDFSAESGSISPANVRLSN